MLLEISICMIIINYDVTPTTIAVAAYAIFASGYPGIYFTFYNKYEHRFIISVLRLKKIVKTAFATGKKWILLPLCYLFDECLIMDSTLF